MSMLDLDTLKAQWLAGQRPELLFFWGHRQRKDGQVGPSCFSQWYAAGFVIDGVTYPTAEHWMMAEKARLFGDEETCALILAAATPAKAKELGRRVRGFDDARWVSARSDIVIRGNLAKFEQHASLGEFLRMTGTQILVEASPTDRIWGIGLAQDDARAADPTRWRGQNLLGFALMEVRGLLARSAVPR